MRRTERLFRGGIHCTVCHQKDGPIKRESWNLVRNEEDGTYSGYCQDHKPDDLYKNESLSLVETCLHFPWSEVVKLTLHKPDPTSYDRKGKVVTVEIKDMNNVSYAQQLGVEALHGLQLMAGPRATIHNYGERGEGNNCWTEVEWQHQHPVEAYIRNKYWGDKQIEKFQNVCRLMCEIHEWELVDETQPQLDRIVKAMDKE